MTRDEFEQLVEEALSEIPEEFLKKLDNVAILIDDEPTGYQLEKAKLLPGQSLFGLYEGIPQTRRGSFYGGVTPDRITIFKRVIEAEFETKEAIRDKIRETVWHEIAHHFGASEAEVKAAIAKRRSGK